MASALQRSLKLLRDQGAIAEKVEHWNPYARKRQDLFGIFDIVALFEDLPISGIQVFNGYRAKEHLAKMECSAGKLWTAAGGEIELHQWVKKKGKWEVEITKL